MGSEQQIHSSGSSAASSSFTLSFGGVVMAFLLGVVVDFFIVELIVWCE